MCAWWALDTEKTRIDHTEVTAITEELTVSKEQSVCSPGQEISVNPVPSVLRIPVTSVFTNPVISV